MSKTMLATPSYQIFGYFGVIISKTTFNFVDKSLVLFYLYIQFFF